MACIIRSDENQFYKKWKGQNYMSMNCQEEVHWCYGQWGSVKIVITSISHLMWHFFGYTLFYKFSTLMTWNRKRKLQSVLCNTHSKQLFLAHFWRCKSLYVHTHTSMYIHNILHTASSSLHRSGVNMERGPSGPEWSLSNRFYTVCTDRHVGMCEGEQNHEQWKSVTYYAHYFNHTVNIFIRQFSASGS